jgi:hypothetical protein
VLRDCFLQVKAFQGEEEMKEDAGIWLVLLHSFFSDTLVYYLSIYSRK